MGNIALLTEPLASAVTSLGARKVTASPMTAAEWLQLDQDIRNRSYWSATVEDERYLDAQYLRIKNYIEQKPGYDRSGFIRDMQNLADQYNLRPTDPKKRNTIQDVGSVRRLNLVWKINTEMAEGYALWKGSMQTLDLYPFQELIRVESRIIPRKWLDIWQANGGKLINGRMIAHKLDNIWLAISRFGNPFPPFDYNSGMGLREISKKEGMHYGLDPNGGDMKKMGFNDTLQADVKSMSDDGIQAVRSKLADAVIHDVKNSALLYTGKNISYTAIASLTQLVAQQVADVVEKDFIAAAAAVLTKRKAYAQVAVKNMAALKSMADEKGIAFKMLSNNSALLYSKDYESQQIQVALQAALESKATPIILLDDSGKAVTVIRVTSGRSLASRIAEASDAFGKKLHAA